MTTAVAAEVHTEASMLKRLRARHAKDAGNGPAWAYMEKVRDNSGFDAKRTADAISLHLWQSRGHEMHGFEVKVSRSDWRRELADPAKAAGWCEVVDRWWIVAPRGIVPAGELPPTWGLLETRGNGLTVAVQAPLLRPKEERPAIGRNLLSCLLRAAGAGLETTPDTAALNAAREEGLTKGREQAIGGQKDWHHMYEQMREQGQKDRDAVREIEAVLGQSLQQWSASAGAKRITEVKKALAAILAGEAQVAQAKTRMTRAAEDLERTAAQIRQAAGVPKVGGGSE